MTNPRPALAEGEVLATVNMQWVELKANGTESSNLTTSLTGAIDWSDIIISNDHVDKTDGLIDIRALLAKGTNGVTIAFFSNVDDIATDTFDFDLLAYKNAPYGPALPVFLTTGNQCLLGTMVAKKHPVTGTAQANGLWCGTIAGTDAWPGGVTVNDSATNRICTISFDLRGCRYLKLNTFNAAGGGTEAGTIGAVITGH